MPQSQPDPRSLWSELQDALASLGHAEFELKRGHIEDAEVHLGDVRRAIGGAALAASEFAQWARLASTVLTPPNMLTRPEGGIVHVPTTD